MAESALTYGLLDAQLRSLGFAPQIQKGRARIYRQVPTGASIILPDVAFDEKVLPHHLLVVRRVLRDYDLGELEQAPVTTPTDSAKDDVG